MVPLTTAALAWAVLLGAVCGGGLWLLVSSAPLLRRRPLASRIAPFLVDVSPSAREMLERRRADASSTLGLLTATPLAFARRALGALLGGAERLSGQLRRAGSNLGVERYRMQQLASLAGGVAAGAAAGVPLAVGLPLAGLVLPVAGAATGVLLRDRLLEETARRRMRRIARELPTTLEFLSMALAAGESIHDSLRRVARVGRVSSRASSAP